MKKSILMVGQSNMAGRGFLGDEPMILDERILMMRNGKFQMMNEPINFDRHVAGIGLAASFAASWLQIHPNDEICLIPCAEGGSTIKDWETNGALFRNAIQQAKLGMEETELIAILWHQGESDSHSELYKEYKDKLQTVLTDFRTSLGMLDLPIIIGGLPETLGITGFGLSCTEHQEITKIIEETVAAMTNIFYVTAKNLTLNPDGIHIDAKSQRRFGIRYFKAFENKEDIKSPLANESELLQSIYDKKMTKNEKLHLLNSEFAMGKIKFEDYMQQFSEIMK